MISKVLGIETSCDETSAAIIENGNVLANIVSSQAVHEQFGGVVPELASRAHIRLITQIIDQAFKKAKIKKTEIDGLAVTYGPGLVGAVLVGLNFAKGLSQSLQIPYIGINHIEGHIYGNFLSNPDITFPHLSLVVSGGHTQLVLMKKHLSYEIIGKTRDDAVGEAFDKGAKLLGLGYPGGPMVDKLARTGNDTFHPFPRAVLKKTPFDFSYSGLKTSLLVYLESKTPAFITDNMNHICASYQRAAVEVLIKKTIRAAKEFNVQSVGIVGGVAANSLLRRWMAEEVKELKKAFYLPEFEYCTDNAAMIARAGLERLQNGKFSPPDLNAYPSLRLGESPAAR
ncbi:MAG: tRNA (adenosine(37)-N6)-threonylcarbamoyltransferase complex transferase subunit TsaD [Calditrichales bacterium]|nr:MAG: tRNA (adenosine(37)-N6)-threonylcarbamoyltransferase complex transferase subunit TsaD [Calditrichales bacterium]